MPNSSSTSRPTKISSRSSTSTRRCLRGALLVAPKNWLRSMIGRSLPRTLATPLTQGLTLGSAVYRGSWRISLIPPGRAIKGRPARRKPMPLQVSATTSCDGRPAAIRTQRSASCWRRSKGCNVSDIPSLLSYAPRCRCRSVTQHRLQCLDQRGFLNGLGQIILGPLTLAPDPVGFLILGGHDDHRDMCGFRVLGELPGSLEAVESGHHDVHQYGVGPFRAGQCRAIGAVLCLEHLASVLFQHAAELVQLGRRIIHYKYASHLSPWIKITGGLSYRRRPPSCPTAEHERGWRPAILPC